MDIMKEKNKSNKMLTKVIMTIVMQYITSMISSSLSYSTVLSGFFIQLLGVETILRQYAVLPHWSVLGGDLTEGSVKEALGDGGVGEAIDYHLSVHKLHLLVEFRI